MDEAGSSGLGYLDGLPSVDDSLYDPSLLYPHFACLTAMGPSSSSLDSSLQPSFLLSSQSPSLLFSPYKELEWLDRPLRDVSGHSTGMLEGGGQEGSNDGFTDRKRSWSDRMATETNEGRCRRMEMNRLRMAEKRARETDEERRERLEKAKEYARSRVLAETEDERDRRKEVNRVRTAIRRGKNTVQRSLEDQLRSMVKGVDEGVETMREESGEERHRRLELVRQYAASKRQRETPEQRRERLDKNRDRMRRSRALKKEEWREFLSQREIIEERLRLMRMQLGEKSPLLESDSILATRLTELLKELANAPRKKEKGGGKVDASRSWSRFFSTRLPPLLSALETLLSNGERSRGSEGEDNFVFGAEASYLDYALFEELDAVCGLSPSVLDDYPTLKGYRERFQQRLNLTTYALMQAGSTLNLSYSVDNQPTTVSAESPLETQPIGDSFHMV